MRYPMKWCGVAISVGLVSSALPSAAAAGPWLDAIAAVDGMVAALAASSRLPVTNASAWADVHERRAVWSARLGRTDESDAALSVLGAGDTVRADLVVADIALATGRPIDAERVLRRLLEKDPGELRRTAGDCCRPNPRTIGGEEFAAAALDAMRRHRITSLFVCDDGGRLAGALHMHDLLAAGI